MSDKFTGDKGNWVQVPIFALIIVMIISGLAYLIGSFIFWEWVPISASAARAWFVITYLVWFALLHGDWEKGKLGGKP